MLLLFGELSLQFWLTGQEVSNLSVPPFDAISVSTRVEPVIFERCLLHELLWHSIIIYPQPIKPICFSSSPGHALNDHIRSAAVYWCLSQLHGLTRSYVGHSHLRVRGQEEVFNN